MQSEVPSELDWRPKGETLVMDEACAYRNFAGKSFDEAVALFEQCALAYQEDLVYMPPACFKFYMQAYVSYLDSDAARGDSDGASCFFDVIKLRKKDVQADEDLRTLLVQMLNQISKRQTWFDADEGIYGSFAERATSVIRLIE